MGELDIIMKIPMSRRVRAGQRCKGALLLPLKGTGSWSQGTGATLEGKGKVADSPPPGATKECGHVDTLILAISEI